MRATSRPLIAITVIALAFVFAVAPSQRLAHAQTASVSIQNFAFSPATLTIPAGTTVTWTNNDTVAHTSTSDPGDAISWNSGTLSQGQSFSFTFQQAGTFTYHCTFHPFMKATIIVQSAAAATATSAPAASATAAPSGTSTSATPTATSVPLSAAPVPSGAGMGPVFATSQPAWQGYYDGHKDTYLSTDISTRAMATAMHSNFAPGLKHAAPSSVDPMYLVPGRAAPHQLAVFGSEPGESDYSPLWREINVTWKQGAKPVLLTSDNQIFALQKKGKLTLQHTSVIMNCPIVKVGKG